MGTSCRAETHRRPGPVRRLRLSPLGPPAKLNELSGCQHSPCACKLGGRATCLQVTGLDVPMIVYCTDVTVDHGPTFVVSKERTAGMPPAGRRYYSRDEYPEPYAAEVPATLPAGSVLIYSMGNLFNGYGPPRLGDASERRSPFTQRYLVQGFTPGIVRG
jgi:hypothetical protein